MSASGRAARMYQVAPKSGTASAWLSAFRRSTVPTMLKSQTNGSARPQPPRRATRDTSASRPLTRSHRQPCRQKSSAEVGQPPLGLGSVQCPGRPGTQAPGAEQRLVLSSEDHERCHRSRSITLHVSGNPVARCGSRVMRVVWPVKASGPEGAGRRAPSSARSATWSFLMLCQWLIGCGYRQGRSDRWTGALRRISVAGHGRIHELGPGVDASP